MPTTAYAVTVTPPEISGFYAPVEVRFEHAAAPAAEPNPNPAYLAGQVVRIFLNKAAGAPSNIVNPTITFEWEPV